MNDRQTEIVEGVMRMSRRQQSNTLVSAAALAGAFALSGCQGLLGHGGTTTIIQQPPAANNNTPASSTPTTSSVTPISDGKQLCSQARRDATELDNAVRAYWKLVSGDAGKGKSDYDPEISSAADKVTSEADKIIPILEGIVGSNAPNDAAEVVKNYTAAAKNFTQAITIKADSEEVSPLASKYGDALKALNTTCKIT